MSYAPVERTYTFEEYLVYNDGTSKHYELEDGALLEMPPASDLHEAIITFLLIHFYQEIQRLELNWEVRPSGTGVRTTPHQSRLPDLIVMTPEHRQSIQGKSAVLEIPPLMIVEVVNKESVQRDYEQKSLEYAAFGVPEYWIIDPLLNKVTVSLLDIREYKQTVFTKKQQILSQIFPELTLTVQRILSA
ncbi:MAG: Uma2 family endonuclease [Calothrix sp. MO_167.B42]|nr:Uma2 family endonuclease [Calothrix sp. MO_167.B42]